MVCLSVFVLICSGAWGGGALTECADARRWRTLLPGFGRFLPESSICARHGNLFNKFFVNQAGRLMPGVVPYARNQAFVVCAFTQSELLSGSRPIIPALMGDKHNDNPPPKKGALPSVGSGTRPSLCQQKRCNHQQVPAQPQLNLRISNPAYHHLNPHPYRNGNSRVTSH